MIDGLSNCWRSPLYRLNAMTTNDNVIYEDSYADELRRRQALMQSEIFGNLEEKDLARMAVEAEEIVLAPNQVLFEKGDEAFRLPTPSQIQL